MVFSSDIFVLWKLDTAPAIGEVLNDIMTVIIFIKAAIYRLEFIRLLLTT